MVSRIITQRLRSTVDGRPSTSVEAHAVLTAIGHALAYATDYQEVVGLRRQDAESVAFSVKEEVALFEQEIARLTGEPDDDDAVGVTYGNYIRPRLGRGFRLVQVDHGPEIGTD